MQDLVGEGRVKFLAAGLITNTGAVYVALLP